MSTDITDDLLEYLVCRGCRDKHRYTLEQVNSAVDKHASEGLALYYYSCYFCTNYHLTSSIPDNDFERRILKALTDKANATLLPNLNKKRPKKYGNKLVKRQ